MADKLRYLTDFVLKRNSRPGCRKIGLRGGASIVLRPNSTDGKVFEEIFIEQAYARYAKIARDLAPVILVDLGANIGLSVIALARELRPRVTIAVEPDRENFAMLQENLKLAGFSEDCVALQAFAGAASGFAELVDSGNGAWGMRMGASAEAGIRVLALRQILAMAGPDPEGPEQKLVLKCDIEGAELRLFEDLLQWEERVHYIILELHMEFLSAEKFGECLEASRYYWRIDGEIPEHAVLAVIGLERLEKKTIRQQQRGARA